MDPMSGTLAGMVLLFAGGLLAGVLGGLLGIGGGVVLMPMLRFLAALPPAQAAGTCIVAVFFTTIGGSYRHYNLGNVNLRSIAPVMIFGAIACVVFSLLFLHLAARERWLDLGMGIIFSMISLRMIVEGVQRFSKKDERRSRGNEIKGSLAQKFSIGFLAGALPGLLGIGTGVILVPAFIYILGAPVKAAMASSLACFSVNALISSIFKYWQGFTDLSVALPICLGTLLGANLGARLNKYCSSGVLRLFFGIVSGCVSLKFILLFAKVTI